MFKKRIRSEKKEEEAEQQHNMLSFALHRIHIILCVRSKLLKLELTFSFIRRICALTPSTFYVRLCLERTLLCVTLFFVFSVFLSCSTQMHRRFTRKQKRATRNEICFTELTSINCLMCVSKS